MFCALTLSYATLMRHGAPVANNAKLQILIGAHFSNYQGTIETSLLGFTGTLVVGNVNKTVGNSMT